MEFSKMKVKDLKQIIKVYKNEHFLNNYSKLKKNELVELLSSKFELKENKLYLKSVVTESESKPKQKKRITPILVSQPINVQPLPINSGLTQGQKTFSKAISKIERKGNLVNHREFAKRIRGNN